MFFRRTARLSGLALGALVLGCQPQVASHSVTGKATQTWVSASGAKDNAVDLTEVTVRALVPSEGGGYVEYPGIGLATGEFEIFNVPEGEYLLEFDRHYFWTSARELDLTRVFNGRRDAVSLDPQASTYVSFDVQNLAPWQDGDALELFSTEADAWWFDFQDDLYVQSSSTVLSGQLLLDSRENRIEESKGDRAVLAQLQSRTSPTGVTYQAMARVFEPESFDVDEGGTTSLSGTFVAVEPSETIALDVRSQQFEQQPFAIGNNIEANGGTVAILGRAGGLAHGTSAATADLLIKNFPSGAGDFATGEIAYGMPLSGEWGVFGQLSFSFTQRYWFDGTEATVTGSILRRDRVASFGDGPLVPLVTPAREVSVDGASFLDSGISISTTPTVSWDPPSTGAPTYYELYVERLSSDSGVGRRVFVARFTTPETSLTLPPDLLESGERYVMALYAVENDHPDIASAPYRQTLPYGSAPVFSGVFSAGF